MSFLGIDLGTTNSVGVIYNDKEDSFEVVMIEDTYEILPSAVNYLDDEIIIGQEAKAGAIIYNDTTVLSVKRLIGTDEKIPVGEKVVTPVEVSAQILKTIKEAAEEQSGEVFNEVVITHPAYFNDKQIFDTKEAGMLAGFETVFLLSEPLASAIEYGYKEKTSQTLLVYDLGGGTFDVCVLNVSVNENGEEVFEELSDVGDMSLGGDDIDNELVNWLKDKVLENTGIDITTLDTDLRKMTMQRLKHEAENAKKKLSTTSKANIVLSPLFVNEGVPVNINIEMTREEFENIIRKYIDRSREIMEQAILRSGKEVEDIDKVVLVGGSTLIPMVKRMVGGYIKEPYNSTDPAKSVAMGASIYNYLIHLPNSKVHVGQITRQIIGTSAITDITTLKRELIPIIPMGSKIPVSITDDKFTNMAGSKEVAVDVYQWEQGFEDDKKYIGTVNIGELQNDAKIQLTYKINENNIFEVIVEDKNTNRLEKGCFDRSKSTVKELQELPSTFTNEVNIVFLIDTTGSMDIYIKGVKDRAVEFSEILEEKGINYNIGLIGYGDLHEKEKPVVFKLTNDVSKFKNNIDKLPEYYGGAIPESTLDALEEGVKLIKKSQIEEDSKNIFVLITDAPPHVPSMAGNNVNDIKEILDKENITTYIVANRDSRSTAVYSELVKDKTHYYGMRAKFFDILDGIAVSITELVRCE